MNFMEYSEKYVKILSAKKGIHELHIGNRGVIAEPLKPGFSIFEKSLK